MASGNSADQPGRASKFFRRGHQLTSYGYCHCEGLTGGSNNSLQRVRVAGSLVFTPNIVRQPIEG